MPKKLPPAFQDEAGRGPCPKTLRETYAEFLKGVEREYRIAQATVAAHDSDANRARYAKAMRDYDALKGMFPFVAAGLGDVQA